MDKETRSAIERVAQRARKVLEEELAAQLEGDFDILRDGSIADKPGKHLSVRQRALREKIVGAIEHKRGAGLGAADAVKDYLRDAAFTWLNRFAALKMLEARSLVQECVSKGEQSAGYLEMCGLAPGLRLLPMGRGYQVYVESLFDELSTEVKVLFDRRDVSSVLWPRRAAFEELLGLLNGRELAGVWAEDETIGWVYQFFNGQDERKKMRDESQAPRNSRELAVRNQFFTPRYVVEFLTDNTLGRIWYEMRRGETALREKCAYLVRQPNELFVSDPAMLKGAQGWVKEALAGNFEAIPVDLPFEEGVYLAHAIDGYASEAARGDAGEDLVARRVRQGFEERGVFEGSAADLWITLFLNHRADRHSGGIGGGGGSPDPLVNALREALLREQKEDAGVRRTVLVPYRAKKDPRDMRVLDPACGSGHFLLYAFDLLITMYEESWGDSHLSNPPSEVTGKTLREEYETLEDLRKAIPGLILANNLHGVDIDARCAQIAQLALWMRAQRAYLEWGISRSDRPAIRRSNVVVAEPLVADEGLAKAFVAKLGDAELGRVFLGLVEGLRLAGDMGLLLRAEDLVKEREVRRGETRGLFAPPEERIRGTIRRFVAERGEGPDVRRRLFAEDAAQGVGLLEVAGKKYEVVLMNPPFGAGSLRAKKDFEKAYPRTKNDVYAAFVERGIELLRSRGRLGAITSRTGFFLSSFRKWREEIVLALAPPAVFADLGTGVLDSAMVETAAYCLEART
ncbi:MAG: DNA methyltransferase [Byssovorax sp.]